MLRFCTAFILLFGLASAVYAQNVYYQIRVDYVRSKENYQGICCDVWCSCPCWEGGNEDYTAKVWIWDNVNTTSNYSGCLTGSANGNANYGFNAANRIQENTSATEFRWQFEAWEDDGDRCNRGGGDDCQLFTSGSFNFRSYSQNTWHSVRVYNGGDHELRLEFRYCNTSPVTWNGNVNRHWVNSGNWNFCGTIPGELNDVVIPNRPNDPALVAPAWSGSIDNGPNVNADPHHGDCRTIEIQNGANLRIESQGGADLEIHSP